VKPNIEYGIKFSSKIVPVHVSKGYEEAELWLHKFLTLAFDGSEWSLSRPGRFTSKQTAAIIYRIGG
jgi:hypothetical protein